MKFEELQKFYLRICYATTIIDHDGIIYYIHDPTGLYHLRGSYYYQQVYDRLTSEGSMTEDQCEALLIEKGEWSVEKEQLIETLKDNLKKFNQRLGELEFKSAEKRSVLEYIEVTKAELNSLFMRKQALLANSAEYLAKLETYKKYLFWLTFDEEGKRIWVDWNAFVKTPNSLISYLINKAYLDNGLTETNIRKVARNEPWRSTWLTASKTGNLFGAPTKDMTDYQRALVTWSIIYDNAFEHPESPSIDIIDNDVLFDQWLEEQSEKRRSKKGKTPEEFITNSKIRNAQEIGIVVDSFEDAQKIYALNDSNAKNIIKGREAKLKEKGQVRDIDMPDMKQRVKMAAVQQHIQQVKNG